MKIRGEVLIADEINSNGIIYPLEAVEKACSDLQNSKFPVLSDFPESPDLISSDLICGKITKAEIENNNLVINANINELGENKVQMYCCAVGIGELDENIVKNYEIKAVTLCNECASSVKPLEIISEANDESVID